MINLSHQQKEAIKSLNPMSNSKFKYDKLKWEKLNNESKVIITDFEDKEISRQDIINSYKEYFDGRLESCVKPFLLTMVWGFANIGFGSYRTNRYISSHYQIIKEAIDTIKNGELGYLGKAFNKLKKINGLGVSYITKVIYFATKAKASDDYALIFDARVASALIKLTTPKEIHEIVKIGPSSKFSDYEKYNKLIHTIAGQIRVDADKMEMYLFNQKFG